MLLIFPQEQHFPVFHLKRINASIHDRFRIVRLGEGQWSLVCPDRFCVERSIPLMLAEHLEHFVACDGKEPRPEDAHIAQGSYVMIHLEEGVMCCVFSEGSIPRQVQAEGEDVTLIAMIEFFERGRVSVAQLLDELFV